MQIITPSERDFKEICRLIEQFELDNRSLEAGQFLIAADDNEMNGFGRIRKHDTCSELCSLGVVEPRRHKGIGSQLVKELTDKVTGPLYLVCIIPDFFEPLGFSVVKVYPPEIQDKLEYCISALSVPEPYVVMKYQKNSA
ncbi:MAG: GNAT family N-acetyltransferase [Bacteroidota bacterium]